MKHVFEFSVPQKLTITKELLRETLADVRDKLLNHGINGGPRKLAMTVVCEKFNSCGTVACIGGWTSIFLLGFEASSEETHQHGIVEGLFSFLIDHVDRSSRLRNLFYEYSAVQDHDEPNVAATAIQRYLDGKTPWPQPLQGGTVPMPDVLPYKRTVAKKKKKKA